jgi:hypothetical protein
MEYTADEQGCNQAYGEKNKLSVRPYFSLFVSQSNAFTFFIPLYVPVS